MNSKEIQAVRDKGKKIQTRFFTVYCIDAEKNGIAVPTSKKLGSAVQRNKIRRRTREAYRRVSRECGFNYKVVFYPKFSLMKANFDDLTSSISSALGSAS